MTIEIQPDLINITSCESITSWSPAPSLDNIMQVELTGCMSAGVSATTSSEYVFTLPGATGADMSNGEHIFAWMSVQGLADYQVSGGLRMYVRDASANDGTWYVGGGDTHEGWNCFCIDPGSTPDVGAGTIDISAITHIGVQFKTLSTTRIVGKDVVANCFWDVIRYGKGYRIVCASGDRVGFEDIYQVDNNDAYKYGIITKKEGVYFCQGKMYFGDDGTGTIDYHDEGEVIIFRENEYIQTGFYGLELSGNSVGNSWFSIGEKAGEAGIKGCFIKNIAYIDVNHTNIDEMKIYGTTFVDISGTILPPYDSGNKEVYSSIFDSSNEVIGDTINIKGCQFINADDRALRLYPTGHHAEDLTFISCPTGVHITGLEGTYEMTLDNMTFSDCDADLENAIVNGIVTGNAINGTNASTIISTQGGDGVILNAVTVAIDVVDAATAPISGARVNVQTTGGQLLLNGMTDSNGSIETTYNYAGNNGIRVRIRKSSSGDPVRYIPQALPGTITVNGYSVTVPLTEDINI